MEQSFLRKNSLALAMLTMTFLVALSNVLVLFPINDWLTWGSFSYPATFLVTELTNRFHGPKAARRVVCVGFVLAVLLSIWAATPKIAFASGAAFLFSQLLDIAVFNRLRQKAWWYAPFFASFAASLVDATIFWNIAFWGEHVPLLTWAIGDTTIKLLVDVAMLTPFRFAIQKMQLAKN
jgi:queuosine precursor transporter